LAAGDPLQRLTLNSTGIQERLAVLAMAAWPEATRSEGSRASVEASLPAAAFTVVVDFMVAAVARDNSAANLKGEKR
jgi:hypothetical protein